MKQKAKTNSYPFRPQFYHRYIQKSSALKFEASCLLLWRGNQTTRLLVPFNEVFITVIFKP